MNFEKFRAIIEERRNVGAMEEPSIVVTFKNDACGDDYVIYLKIDGNTILDAKFTTTGCEFGLAAFSLATDWVRGKTLEEAERIPTEVINAGLIGVFTTIGHFAIGSKEFLRPMLEASFDPT
jgi:NifU-like protein involved in Fe-S cluster formation